MATYSYSKIVGFGSYLPARIVDNHELSRWCNTSDEWIQTRTGIKARRFAAENESTSDLATLASKNALKDSKLKAEEIDFIIATTHTADHYFPGIGVQVQKKLGCRKIPAIDLRGQCSGFSWALCTGDALIRAGFATNILICSAEIHSRFLDFSNVGRSLAVIHGDGAGAIVLSSQKYTIDLANYSASEFLFPVIYGHELGSDGSGIDALVMRDPGMNKNTPYFGKKLDLPQDNVHFYPEFQGPIVFRHAVEEMAASAQKILNRFDLNVKDIDCFIPHQANLRIISAVSNRLQLSSDQIFVNIQEIGNTGSASLPVALDEARKKQKIKDGNLILTTAFGGGFCWGSNLFRI